MKVDTYRVLERAVRDGLGHGWRRAHKHVESPDREAILDAMQSEIMNEVCEWFSFDDPTEEWGNPTIKVGNESP